MYPALHETDVTKFAEEMEKRRANLLPETNLKRIRTAYGCSQSELARLSGVSLRSIQMYEQRNKDINRAQAESLGMIARALGCKIEDLLAKAV
jgi:transcriptional regulator with XRE-family HTH domain